MILGPEAIDARHREILEAARAIAETRGVAVYLVGGPVRDLLLGLPLSDVDLTVEGDARAIADDLAAASGGAGVRASHGFLTYKLMLGGELVDIATCRRERYIRPGALPEVEPASIGEDLMRRDFTINAMAIELRSWSLLDLVGGRADLSARLVRVLHPRSFADDPSRVFRAIRIAARLGFELEPETIACLQLAITDGVLASVSRERLWRELLLAIGERAPAKCLLDLAGRGVLAELVGVAGTLSAALLEAADRAEKLRGQREVIYLGILLAGSPSPWQAIEHAPLPRAMIESICDIARDPTSLATALSHATAAEAAFRACEGASVELRSIARLANPELAPLLDRFEWANAHELGIRGDELGVPAGPWIGDAFRATRLALFEGAVEPAGAAAFAQNAAVQYLRERDPRG